MASIYEEYGLFREEKVFEDMYLHLKHVPKLQDCVSVSEPVQSLPPFSGEGLLQLLSLVITPSLQVLEH